MTEDKLFLTLILHGRNNFLFFAKKTVWGWIIKFQHCERYPGPTIDLGSSPMTWRHSTSWAKPEQYLASVLLNHFILHFWRRKRWDNSLNNEKSKATLKNYYYTTILSSQNSVEDLIIKYQQSEKYPRLGICRGSFS